MTGRTLISSPSSRRSSERLKRETGAVPDEMPIDPQLRMELPDKDIR